MFPYCSEALQHVANILKWGSATRPTCQEPNNATCNKFWWFIDYAYWNELCISKHLMFRTNVNFKVNINPSCKIYSKYITLFPKFKTTWLIICLGIRPNKTSKFFIGPNKCCNYLIGLEKVFNRKCELKIVWELWLKWFVCLDMFAKIRKSITNRGQIRHQSFSLVQTNVVII